MIAEEILKESGNFGPAQWCLLSLFSLVNIFSSFHYFAQTFITLSPTHVCNSTQVEVKNESDILHDVFKDTNEIPWGFITLTSELNWICENAWKSALIQSMFFIGSVTGTLVLGSMSDVFGRIPMLIVANLFSVLGNLLTIYLNPNLWSLSIARFIAGLATDTNFFMMYIIVMEYIEPRMRTFGLNLCIGLWYCIGCVLVPWVAVLTKNWHTFLLTISIPNIVIPLSCCFVPESAQWLLSVGRTDDAIACYQKIASFNRKKISNEFIEHFKLTFNSNISSAKTTSLLGLFKTPRLRRKTCILIFKTIVLSLCYDAISRNVEGLGWDPFTVFSVTSATILPSCLIILLLQDRLGRKILAVFFLMLTGLFNFGQGSVLIFWKNVASLGAVVGILGRFSVNVAYNSGTQYAAELIPTQVRGQGLAVMHAIGYGATFFSPQILLLSNYWVATPPIILGVLSLLGSVFCLFLPETLNKTLPATLEDGENFGENEKIWDFLKQRMS